ncbi:MAG: DUF1905 domain-containing protein [Polyangiaceae bacterium]|nr:DUF1905 domain-containing protein [Myxococcales bacterium]MCB9590504.1 DUF1905 domain-containing protein [Polyangiaceae bacterium]MCB9608497.1 DUF1905 domain-containing protein [Polyangiaceae bacterium]
MAKFSSKLLATGKNTTGIEVPEKVLAALAAGKRPKVSVTLNGYTYRTSIGSMGGKSLIPVSAAVREAAGVAAGDSIKVELELDEAPREVSVPPDFAKALKAAPAAKRCFETLAYSHQRRHVEAIEGAKQAETRERRIEKAIAMLAEGKK